MTTVSSHKNINVHTYELVILWNFFVKSLYDIQLCIFKDPDRYQGTVEGLVQEGCTGILMMEHQISAQHLDFQPLGIDLVSTSLLFRITEWSDNIFRCTLFKKLTITYYRHQIISWASHQIEPKYNIECYRVRCVPRSCKPGYKK